MTRRHAPEALTLRALMQPNAPVPADSSRAAPATVRVSWPAIPSRPGVNATHEQYQKAQRVYGSQLQDVMAHLKATLDEAAYAAVERAVQLGAEHAWTRLMADGSRHTQSAEYGRPTTRQHNRRKHVQQRLKERFDLHLTDRQVAELSRQWERCPFIRLGTVTVMKRVTYMHREIEAIYEVLDTGGLELCTVLDPNRRSE